MKQLTIFYGLLSLLMSTALFARSEIISSDTFLTVQQLIVKNKNPHHLLLALDDDDTLTMTPCPSFNHCQRLGSPEWFSWQAKLPKGNQNRIWKNFPELLNINNLIFNMSKMVLTDLFIPNTLKTADKRGVYTLVTTARGYNMLGATEKQLTQDGILHLIEKNALHTTTNHIGFSEVYYPHQWNNKPVRRIAYSQGILYLAGLNKGEMIKQFLSKIKQTNIIHIIIFVDDTYKNIIDVSNSYKNNSSVHVICVYYTKLKAHKAEFLTGKNAKKLQADANMRWYAIRDALKKNLPGFDL